MLSEAEGCSVLKVAFAAAGYAIAENVCFEEQGVTVLLDGWDASRRVGYEYITREAGDDREFTPAVVAALEARIGRGELALFLIDERDIADRELLRLAAAEFLERVQGGMPIGSREERS